MKKMNVTLNIFVELNATPSIVLKKGVLHT